MVLVYSTLSKAAEVALAVTESGRLRNSGVLHSGVVACHRTGRLEVTTSIALDAAPDPNAWWTLLISVLAQGPIGAGWGLAPGVLWGTLIDQGVDDRFLRSVVEAMTPGASGWFLDIEPDLIEAVEALANETGATLLTAEIPPEIEESIAEQSARAVGE